jgi:oxygen-independent coproporphyrinogen III oxidase
MPTAGIYIHIPFCKVKCIYCDFYSITEQEHQREHFTNMLCREIEQYRKNHQFNFNIDTIFIGGGTPSILEPTQLEKILNTINICYNIGNESEITMEVNPGEAPIYKLKEFKALGINRISMGFQSLQPKLLKFLTRIHTNEQAIETYTNARDVGFENINIDMIFSIPNQTQQMLENDLLTLIKLAPNHISAYSLTVESGTELNRMVKKKTTIMPSDELDLNMLLLTRDILIKNNYNPYEISNFSLTNNECKHNIHYWNSDPYLAFGPSAHGFNNIKRWWNVRSLDEYLKRLEQYKSPIIQSEITTDAMRFNEILLNGLRLKIGVSINKLKSTNKNYLSDLDIGLKKWDGKIILNNESLHLTDKGIPFLDSILPDLFID